MYTLTFTIYSLLFTVMLFVTILMKKRKNSVKSKLFIWIIVFGMLVALFEIVAITVNLNYWDNPIFLKWIWNFRMICIFLYIESFMIYYDVLMNGEKYSDVISTVFKKRKNLVIFIFFTLLIVAYLFVGNYSITDKNSIVYLTGFVVRETLIFDLIVAFYLLFVASKVRKTRRNVYNCFTLIFLLIVIVFPVQLIIPNISLMPMCILYILYIVYHNIEDPDIELLEEVSILKKEVDSTSNSKTDFLYNLSYDLIIPVNTINSLVTNINSMDVYNRDVVVKNYKDIISASNIVLDSVNDMVDFSIDNGKSNYKEYNVYELILKLRTLVVSKIGSKNIMFDLNIGPNVNSKYFGEIDKIQKILVLLLGNACRYTNIGKIKLDITAKENNDLHTITFRVYDTGSGMTEEAQKIVFEGNNLSMCKNLIESMGGNISFKSVYGGGSSFYVTINQKPVGTGKAVDDVSYDNKNEVIEYRDLSNYKVLLVDDSEINNKVTSKLLSEYKIQITSITSSLECVDKIKREEEYDIIFIDHRMDELDGIEVVNLLRSLEGYKIPKIVCLTANVFTGARDYYLSRGFDEYLSKPIDVHDLDRVINKFIKRD